MDYLDQSFSKSKKDPEAKTERHASVKTGIASSQHMDKNTKPVYSETLKPGCFRLLQVDLPHGANVPTRPEGRLSTHPLSQCPPYAALSYAWNEPYAVPDPSTAEQHTISLNNHTIPAPGNLFSALRHLASRQKALGVYYFWVDAICIDQSSTAERTEQVAIMHQIYRQAVVVEVWLGPDPDGEAGLVREFFRAVLQRFFHDTGGTGLMQKKYARDFINDDKKALLDAGLPAFESEIWTEVVRFWDRAWFYRIWVLQEVALAQHLSFWCGEVEFSRRELVECSRFFTLSGLSSLLMTVRYRGTDVELNHLVARQVGTSAIRMAELQPWAMGEHLLVVGSLARIADRLTGPVIRDSSGRDTNSLLRIFVTQLHHGFNDGASDARDRVFALLVLLKQMAVVHGLGVIPIQADYSNIVSSVFTEATTWIIEQSGWLGMLSLIHPQRVLETEAELPSWVPDFTSAHPCALLLLDPDVNARISTHVASITAETRLNIRGQSLLVSMKRIGKVSDIGDTYADYMERGTFEVTARLLLKMPESIWPGYTRIDYWTDVMDCKMDITYPSSSTRRSQLRHWLVFAILRKINQDFNAGRIAKGRERLYQMPHLEALAQEDTSRTLPTWEDWINVYAEAEKQIEVRSQRPVFKFYETWNRRLFRLVDLGFPHCPSATVLGIGPETTRPGDEVFHVVGNVMPLVVRRAPTLHTRMEGPKQTRVVGEGFITGLNAILSRMKDQAHERSELV